MFVRKLKLNVDSDWILKYFRIGFSGFDVMVYKAGVITVSIELNILTLFISRRALKVSKSSKFPSAKDGKNSSSKLSNSRISKLKGIFYFKSYMLPAGKK